MWNDIISEINHIDPATIDHGQAHCRCLGTNRCAHMPHYASNIAIRGNPVFRYIHIYRGVHKGHNGEETSSKTLRHYRGLQLRSWDDTSDLDASANHFITDPPITMIVVGGPRFGASLRVPTGIRAGDLRDVVAKLVGANTGYAKPSTATPIAWYACMSDIIRDSDDTGNRTAEHDEKNEVGAKIARLSFAS